MNEFKVGLLALAAIVATAYMSLKVTSNQSGFGDYVSYRTIISDASGIFPKTPIKVAGINAGRINKIELQGNKALIHFEVLKDILISRDSKLRIKSVGFLGDKYLEIFVGDSKDPLPDNGFVLSEEGGGIEDLVKDATEVLSDVKVIIGSLKDSIAPDGREAPITTILKDIEELMKNGKEAMITVNEIMDTNHAKIDNLISNLERFSSDLSYQVSNKNSDSAMSDVKRILANVDELTFELKTLVTDIKSGKGTVGQLLVEDQIADEVKETLAGVRKIVNRVDAIRTEISVFVAANSDYGNRNDVSLKIFPAPDRFYLFGVRSSEFTPTTTTYTTTTTTASTLKSDVNFTT
jgi:phospholipid/cholesterol/gamma-HCH transport system substrate-binding protein